MRTGILFAPRFRGSDFLADLRTALAQTPEPDRDGSRRLFPIIVLGMPRIAIVLGFLFGNRLTLVLDDSEALDETLESRLLKLRVACFSFDAYSRLRRIGVNAAYFEWAPPPTVRASFGAGQVVAAGAEPQNHHLLQEAAACLRRPRWIAVAQSFIGRARARGDAARAISAKLDESGAVYVAAPDGSGLDADYLGAMARGAMIFAPDHKLFRQFITHGVSGLLAGHDCRSLPNQAPAIRDMARRVTARARRRFQNDHKRLGAFTAGLPIAHRTNAAINWPAAPVGARVPAAGAKEGGARLRGKICEDLPDAPLITVAIVVRNARRFFAPTLASVLAQDYPHLEIIAVDGDSTDGTCEEIAARDELIDYWISGPDAGPYDGMNKAARLARGRFLIFMNAGDFFPHEAAVSEAFESPATFESDIVIGHHVYVDRSGIESLHKAASFEETWRAICAGDISWTWLSGIPCGQAVFVRTQLLREQPFDHNYRIAADHAFLYEARRNCRRFVHCDSVIGVYTSGGLSGSDERKTSKELLRLARSYGPQEKVDSWFKKNMPYAFESE